MLALAPLLVTLALAQPTTQPTTAPAETPLEAARREEREDIAASTTRPGVTPGEPARVGDLIHGTIRNGFLVISTRLPADRANVVRPVAGVEGAVVRVRVGRPRPPGVAPAPVAPPGGAAEPTPMIDLQLRRPGGTEPGDVLTQTELTANADEGTLNIVRQHAGLDERASERVTLLQFPPAGDEQETPVTLRVDRDDPDAAGGGAKTYVTAVSFLELARTEPTLFQQYVRPMLADLGLESVLDDQVRAEATQIYLDRLAADEATLGRVESLLPKLDAESYEERNAAQEALARLGQPGATVLSKYEGTRLSPEQKSRVAAVLAAYRPLAPEQAAARRDDAAFLRDVLRLDGQPQDAILRGLAQTRLDELSSDKPWHDVP